MAAGAFQRTDFSGPHPTGDRSRASFPVRAEQRFRPCFRPEAERPGRGHPRTADAARLAAPLCAADRKSVVEGKRVSVRLDLGGRRIIKKKNKEIKKKHGTK